MADNPSSQQVEPHTLSHNLTHTPLPNNRKGRCCTYTRVGPASAADDGTGRGDFPTSAARYMEAFSTALRQVQWTPEGATLGWNSDPGTMGPEHVGHAHAPNTGEGQP